MSGCKKGFRNRWWKRKEESGVKGRQGASSTNGKRASRYANVASDHQRCSAPRTFHSAMPPTAPT